MSNQETEKTTIELVTPARDKVDGLKELHAGYKESAKLFEETHVIKHTPRYTESVTEKSLGEHVEFIRNNVVAAAIATSEIAFEQAKENKDAREWRGKLDMPGVSSEIVIHPHEKFHNPKTGKDEFEYGHHDIILDFKMGAAHTSILEELHDIDAKRYEELFTSDKE